MRRCLELARQAEGRTTPNPIVGAVVLDDQGRVVGEGFHAMAGQPHAEVNAFDAAGEAAHGGTLYVNLEPCCHHGRTPPCSDRVIKSGVRRVVVGITDPNPQVHGGGIRALQEQGIEVVAGVMENQCRIANRAFLSHIIRGRPWTCLKMAMTLDGRSADRNGQARWISGTRARKHVHELRNIYDCVMIGGATARADDAELTVRDLAESRNPVRAVIDPQLSLSPQAKVCQPGARTLLFCSQPAADERAALYHEPVEVYGMDTVGGAECRLNLASVMSKLNELRLNSVLCEGGARLGAALIEAELVDEAHWIIAPKFLVDGSAVPVLNGANEVALPKAVPLSELQITRFDHDILLSGMLNPPSLWAF